MGEQLAGLSGIPPLPLDVSSTCVKQEPLSEFVNEPPKKKARLAGKKRSREQAPIDPSILMDKEKLLTISSQKLDEYIQHLSRPLTMDEEKQLKKQRRLIKNRESAQLSRQKKKQYVEDLEIKVNRLTAEANNLRAQVNNLSTTNQQLEEQVNYLQTFIKNQGHEVPAPPQTHSFNKNTAATAGICMFVILFSFGLFFSAGSAPGAIAPIDFTPQRVYTGRTLAEFPEIELQNEVPQISAKRCGREFDDLPEPKRPRVELLDKDDVDSDSGYWIEEEPLDFGIPEKPYHSQIVVSQSSSEIKPQENNTFIYCSEAHQITTPIQSEETDGAPVITILLPAAVLNGTLPYLDDLVSEPENSLFEVSCQVLNITVFPFYPTVDHLAVTQHLLS